MTNKVVCCGETNFRCDSRINHVDAANSHTVSNARPWIATRSTSTEGARGSDPLSTIWSTRIGLLFVVAQIHVMKTRNPCNKILTLDSDQIHVNGGGSWIRSAVNDPIDKNTQSHNVCSHDYHTLFRFPVSPWQGIYNPICIVLFLSRNVFASTGQETNRNDMKRNDMKWHCFVGFACLAYLVLSWHTREVIMPSIEATDFTDVTLLSEDNLRNQNRSNQGYKVTKDHSHCSVTHQLPHDL